MTVSANRARRLLPMWSLACAIALLPSSAYAMSPCPEGAGRECEEQGPAIFLALYDSMAELCSMADPVQASLYHGMMEKTLLEDKRFQLDRATLAHLRSTAKYKEIMGNASEQYDKINQANHDVLVQRCQADLLDAQKTGRWNLH